MSQPKDNNKSKKGRKNDVFRLVVLDDDTLAEIKSKRFTINGLISSIVLILLLIIVIISSLMAFTPLKYLIPGYGDIENNKVYIELNEKINALEAEINTQRVYTEGIKNILNPNDITLNKLDEELTNNRNNSTKASNYNNYSNTNLAHHYYFCNPIKGEISARFDIGIKHFGIDIVAPKDTPVKSVLSGVVINADWSSKSGNTISIQHPDNFISVYKHNSKLLKKIGEKVNACDAVAIIGNTGELTSGPHVHIELWKNGIAVDPDDYLDFNY